MNDRPTHAEPAAEPASGDTSEPQSTNLPVVYEPPEKPQFPTFLQRLAYAFRPKANASVRQNLQQALASEADSDQTISPSERKMLANILHLREIRVVDVMIPRAEIEAVDMSTTLGELLALFESSGHSRLPVYVETLDDPRGMIHIRDVVAHIIAGGRKRKRVRKSAPARNGNGNGADKSAENGLPALVDLSGIDLKKTIGQLKLARSVLFVPPSMLATDLMARMQASRTQMALVIDEYGGTDGLVSLEDIVEMVVGDIEDEHDDEDVRIESRGDGSFMVDARVELEDISEHLGGDFLTSAHEVEDEVDTLGGLVFSILGRVPVRGEVVHGVKGYEIEVCDADPRRIRTAIVKAVKHSPRRRPVKAKGKANGQVSETAIEN